MEKSEIYREIVENSNVAIFLEHDSLLVYANRKTIEIFEFEFSELGQISWRDFLSPEPKRSLSELPSNEDPGIDCHTIQIRTKSGQNKWIELHYVPWKWEGKSAKLYFGRDITQQKYLANRSQMAKRVEAMGMFAGSIAHDFNNILSPILGYTELTMDEIDPKSPTYSNLSKLYKATNRAKDLVQQILAFSIQTEAVSKEDNQVEVGSVDTISGGTEHIFLVDNEKYIGLMVEEMLKDLGYQVSSRTSSLEAYQTFENQSGQYNLVITGQIMPNLSGEELARKIKEIRPELPIILCTGFSKKHDREKLKAKGFTDIIFKPVLKKDLAITIRRALDATT